MEILQTFVEASRVNTDAGAKPQCLLDLWMEVERDSGERLPADEVALHMLDFLFASQDATTSAMVWILVNLSERPDVHRRVLEEQEMLRPNDEPVTYESVGKMKTTSMVGDFFFYWIVFLCVFYLFIFSFLRKKIVIPFSSSFLLIRLPFLLPASFCLFVPALFIRSRAFYR